ncbi:MAG: hypothetical protein AB8G05_23340 [Oligoflexales bacterium]
MLFKSFIILALSSLLATACGESKESNSAENKQMPLVGLSTLERENNTFDASVADAQSSNEFSDEEPCDQFVTDPKTGLIAFKECEDLEKAE